MVSRSAIGPVLYMRTPMREASVVLIVPPITDLVAFILER
jgi:hypothetical protein